MSGWISLHRKILNNPILSNNRIYSRMEAFIFLLLKANHKDNDVVVGTTLYKVNEVNNEQLSESIKNEIESHTQERKSEWENHQAKNQSQTDNELLDGTEKP